MLNEFIFFREATEEKQFALALPYSIKTLGGDVRLFNSAYLISGQSTKLAYAPKKYFLINSLLLITNVTRLACSNVRHFCSNYLEKFVTGIDKILIGSELSRELK